MRMRRLAAPLCLAGLISSTTGALAAPAEVLAAVNLRTGPGVGFDVVKAVGKGAVLIPVEADGWRPVLFGDDVCWINEKYIEEFST